MGKSLPPLTPLLAHDEARPAPTHYTCTLFPLQNFTWEHKFFKLGILMPPDRMHQTDSGTTKHLIQRCILLLEHEYSGMALSAKMTEFDRCVQWCPLLMHCKHILNAFQASSGGAFISSTSTFPRRSVPPEATHVHVVAVCSEDHSSSCAEHV